MEQLQELAAEIDDRADSLIGTTSYLAVYLEIEGDYSSKTFQENLKEIEEDSRSFQDVYRLVERLDSDLSQMQQTIEEYESLKGQKIEESQWHMLQDGGNQIPEYNKEYVDKATARSLMTVHNFYQSFESEEIDLGDMLETGKASD